MSYLARLKQIESEKNSHHAPDSEPSKPSKVPFEPFEGTHPGVYIEKINNAATLTVEQETAIRAWLALIEETDPDTIAEVIGRCQQDADARDYFTSRAVAKVAKK
jgi:hypothetical protein